LYLQRREDLPGIATKVRLTYQMFEIEKEPTCKYDYLEVNSVSLVRRALSIIYFDKNRSKSAAMKVNRQTGPPQNPIQKFSHFQVVLDKRSGTIRFIEIFSDAAISIRWNNN